MLNLGIFSILDRKAEAFMQPFFSANANTAIRDFKAVAEEQGHQFHKHADDYALFYIGDFDSATGKIECYDPLSIAEAREFALPAANTAELREIG